MFIGMFIQQIQPVFSKREKQTAAKDAELSA